MEVISLLVLVCGVVGGIDTGENCTEAAFSCLSQVHHEKDENEIDCCSSHPVYCSLRYDFIASNNSDVEKQYKHCTDEMNYNTWAKEEYSGHSFDEQGFCWLPSEATLCDAHPPGPNIEHMILCNFRNCNSVRLMNEIYAPGQNEEGRLLEATITAVKKQHCQNVTITAEVKCAQCKRFFPEYHEENCVKSPFPVWPWVVGVVVGLSFVSLAGFFVYKRQVVKKSSGREEENVELLQYEMPNARTQFGPEGFFLAQDDSGDLLVDKKSDKELFEQTLLSAHKLSKLDSVVQFEKTDGDNWVSRGAFYNSDFENVIPVTLDDIVRKKKPVTLFGTLKMMQSIIEGFSKLNSDAELHSFFSSLRRNGGSLQVTTKNFVFDQNFVEMTNEMEQDYSLTRGRCFFRFILNNQQQTRASGKVDISSDEIYNLGEPLVEYGDFLYSIKVILGIILQLTIADRSSFLDEHPYVKLYNRLQETGSMPFAEVLKGKIEGGRELIAELGLSDEFVFCSTAFNENAATWKSTTEMPRPKSVNFSLEPVLRHLADTTGRTLNLENFDNALWNPEQNCYTFQSVSEFLDVFEDVYTRHLVDDND